MKNKIDTSLFAFPKPFTNKNIEKLKETRILKKIKKDILETNNTMFKYCEYCKKNCQSLELHHIIYRSECPNHPKKHSKENSLLLCRDCHKLLHNHKNLRNKYIKERKLWEIFDFIKKEHYE